MSSIMAKNVQYQQNKLEYGEILEQSNLSQFINVHLFLRHVFKRSFVK